MGIALSVLIVLAILALAAWALLAMRRDRKRGCGGCSGCAGCGSQQKNCPKAQTDSLPSTEGSQEVLPPKIKRSKNNHE